MGFPSAPENQKNIIIETLSVGDMIGRRLNLFHNRNKTRHDLNSRRRILRVLKTETIKNFFGFLFTTRKTFSHIQRNLNLSARKRVPSALNNK